MDDVAMATIPGVLLPLQQQHRCHQRSPIPVVLTADCVDVLQHACFSALLQSDLGEVDTVMTGCDWRVCSDDRVARGAVEARVRQEFGHNKAEA